MPWWVACAPSERHAHTRAPGAEPGCGGSGSTPMAPAAATAGSTAATRRPRGTRAASCSDPIADERVRDHVGDADTRPPSACLLGARSGAADRCRETRLIRTSARGQSPKPAPNRPNPTASSRGPATTSSAPCRSLSDENSAIRVPENRGVPGSSPGLAIVDRPGNRAFCVRRRPTPVRPDTPVGLSGFLSSRRTMAESLALSRVSARACTGARPHFKRDRRSVRKPTRSRYAHRTRRRRPRL
jgi:hypothetical protein